MWLGGMRTSTHADVGPVLERSRRLGRDRRRPRPRPRGRPRRAAAEALPQQQGVVGHDDPHGSRRARRQRLADVWSRSGTGLGTTRRSAGRAVTRAAPSAAAAGLAARAARSLGHRRAADAVVRDPHPQRRSPSWRRPIPHGRRRCASRRWSAPRRRRSRRRSRRAAAACRARRGSTRRGPRRAGQRVRAAGRPRSARTGGAIPRDRARSSSSASRAWLSACPGPRGGGRGRPSKCCWARPSSIARWTSRCCGPSWMSRSRRRSAAASAWRAASRPPSTRWTCSWSSARLLSRTEARLPCTVAANRTTIGSVTRAKTPIPRLSQISGVRPSPSPMSEARVVASSESIGTHRCQNQ